MGSEQSTNRKGKGQEDIQLNNSNENENEDVEDSKGQNKNDGFKGKREDSKNTLVVVNLPPPSTEENSGDIQQDPVIKKLEQIQTFFPIMPNEKKGFFGKDPKPPLNIDSEPLERIVGNCQKKFQSETEEICKEQAKMYSVIKEIDKDIDGLLKTVVERQKKYVKISESLNVKLGDLKGLMTKCQISLNDSILKIEVLNEMLPPEEREVEIFFDQPPPPPLSA